MNKIQGLMAIVAVAMYFTSCSNDDGPSYTKTAIANTELKTFLMGKGYTFNEQGNLELNNLANNTTVLDLSGAKLSDLSGLDILPNLTEVKLSDNGYGPTFDFAKLPAQITGVDLTGNDIYDFDNLVKTETAENGDETITVLHNLSKLHLPANAKFDCTNLVRFYRQNKVAVDAGTIDMKMQDASGSLQKYTTLRSIPDEGLKTYLKEKFSDIFDGDRIDLNKHLGNEQKIDNIYLSSYFGITSVTSLEGLQYIVQNPYWEGTTLLIQLDEKAELPVLKLNSTLTLLQIGNLDIPHTLDFTGAKNLREANFYNVTSLKTVDISHSSVWGQRGTETEKDDMVGSKLEVVGCPAVKEIILPKKSKLNINSLGIEDLPALETFDMSNIEMLCQLRVGDLSDNFKLAYPNLTIFAGNGGMCVFACTEHTYKREEANGFPTQKFIAKYHTKGDNNKLSPSSIMEGSKEGYRGWY